MNDLEQRVESLIQFYESRRFAKPRLQRFEPAWNLVPFTCLYRWRAGEQTAEDRESVEDAVKSLALAGLNEGFLSNSYIEDGFKVGSASWVFIGRALPGTEVIPWGKDIVILGRCIPEPTRQVMQNLGFPANPEPKWIAYSLQDPLHETGIGPCKSLDDVMAWIKKGYM